MKSKITLVARLLLGLIFFTSGVTGLLNLIPPPANMPEKLMTFNTGLAASGYFFPFLKITETTCGCFLLSGYFVQLALVILAPISLNIFLVHASMAPSGLPLASVIGILLIYLSFFSQPYSSVIKSLFQSKIK
ncbi:MAG: DoxX family membrane protein [Bdellovibrio sp.]